MNVNQEKNIVYNLFQKQFSHLRLTKIKKIEPNYSVYYALSCGLLCVNNKYIVIVVENDFHNVGDSIDIEDLYWVSFQTRTIDKLQTNIKILESSHVTIPTQKMQSKIKLIQKKKDRYIYSCDDFPCLQIELLISKDDTNFSETGTLQSALDTYACSIKFLI